MCCGGLAWLASLSRWGSVILFRWLPAILFRPVIQHNGVRNHNGVAWHCSSPQIVGRDTLQIDISQDFLRGTALCPPSHNNAFQYSCHSHQHRCCTSKTSRWYFLKIFMCLLPDYTRTQRVRCHLLYDVSTTLVQRQYDVFFHAFMLK